MTLFEKPKRKNESLNLEEILEGDEHPRWIGKPNPRQVLYGQDWYIITFSVIWCLLSFGFLVFGLPALGWAVLASGLLLPHLWLALWLFPFRFIYESYRRTRITYLITNKRVIIISGVFKQTSRSFHLDQLPQRKLNIHRDGSGTIKFQQHRDGNRYPHATTDFYDIPDVYQVAQEIQAAHDDFYYDPDANILTEDAEIASYKLDPKSQRLQETLKNPSAQVLREGRGD